MSALVDFQPQAKEEKQLKIEEIMQTTVTFGAKKKREAGVWNLEKNESLRKAIEECLETGKEVMIHDVGEALYQIIPRYPLIDSAMQRPENAHLKKVSVKVFVPAFSLGVCDDLPPAATSDQKSFGD
jgi:hypothetical protein